MWIRVVENMNSVLAHCHIQSQLCCGQNQFLLFPQYGLKLLMFDLVKYQQYLSPALTHTTSFERATWGTELCCNWSGSSRSHRDCWRPQHCAVTGELWLSMVRLEQCPEAEPGAQPQLSCGLSQPCLASSSLQGSFTLHWSQFLFLFVCGKISLWDSL